MTDYTELKRLAKAAPESPWFGPEYAPGTSYVFDVDLGTLLEYQSIDTEKDACLRYVAAANPAAVLALIAENDSQRKDLQNLRTDNAQLIYALKQEEQSYLVLRAERDQLKAENEALRDCLRLRVSAMPRDRLRETFNAAYYGPRELGSDGEQCRAGVIAVIDAALDQGEQS